MPVKKTPETDEKRHEVLRRVLDQEELNSSQDKILTIREFHEIRIFLLSFEGNSFVNKQTTDDERNAGKTYEQLFSKAQLYISHFIQVLQLAVIRNEIRPEALALYDFENGKEMELPSLSTEVDLLCWGERLIKGETERTYQGGVPIYNPAIAKVKVHYDLFKESIQSLKIYRQNYNRSQGAIEELRNKADEYIQMIWDRVEKKYWNLSPADKLEKQKNYLIDFYYQKGEQLDVFG
jgi:hypothetical protein